MYLASLVTTRQTYGRHAMEGLVAPAEDDADFFPEAGFDGPPLDFPVGVERRGAV